MACVILQSTFYLNVDKLFNIFCDPSSRTSNESRFTTGQAWCVEIFCDMLEYMAYEAIRTKKTIS